MVISTGRNALDEANSVQQTADGGYIVAGYAYSNDGDVSGNHGKMDLWVVKLIDLESNDFLNLLNDYIQNLPSGAFDEKADMRKRALSIEISEIKNLIDRGCYKETIDELQDIRDKVDSRKEGWITDRTAQTNIRKMLDDLAAHFEPLLPTHELDAISDYIKGLRNAAFKGDSKSIKKALACKLFDIENLINSGDYHDAICELKNIRAKADGEGKDLILDSNAQPAICRTIDHLITQLKASRCHDHEDHHMDSEPDGQIRFKRSQR
jgi:hypothetical protein